MRDMVGHRILIAHLPAEMKVFHMKHVPEDRTLSESVDLVIPGVGAIVGMSMRIDDYDDLIAAYKAYKLDPTPSYWYTDRRKHGTCPHRGPAPGLKFFVKWLLGDDHILNLCLNSRDIDRCEPSSSFSKKNHIHAALG